MTILFFSILQMSAVIASKWEKVTTIFKASSVYISNNIKFFTL